jgi:hypothetical protein
LNCLFAEIKLAASGLKQFRQRLRTAEREGFFVVGQRLALVAFGIGPDLQRAKLRDAVFDAAKRGGDESRTTKCEAKICLQTAPNLR